MIKERRYIQDLSPWDILIVDKIKFLFYEPIWKYGKRRIIGHRKMVYFWWVVEKKEWDKYYTHWGPMIVYVLKLGAIINFLLLRLVGKDWLMR
jgi:hypothetical protein